MNSIKNKTEFWPLIGKLPDLPDTIEYTHEQRKRRQSSMSLSSISDTTLCIQNHLAETYKLEWDLFRKNNIIGNKISFADNIPWKFYFIEKHPNPRFGSCIVSKTPYIDLNQYKDIWDRFGITLRQFILYLESAHYHFQYANLSFTYFSYKVISHPTLNKKRIHVVWWSGNRIK